MEYNKRKGTRSSLSLGIRDFLAKFPGVCRLSKNGIRKLWKKQNQLATVNNCDYNCISRRHINCHNPNTTSTKLNLSWYNITTTTITKNNYTHHHHRQPLPTTSGRHHHPPSPSTTTSPLNIRKVI